MLGTLNRKVINTKNFLTKGIYTTSNVRNVGMKVLHTKDLLTKGI